MGAAMRRLLVAMAVMVMVLGAWSMPAGAVMYDGHQSGRFTASAAQVRHALLNLAESCTVGAWTEARNLVVPFPWRQTHGETVLVWDRQVWRADVHGYKQLPTPPWKRGTEVRHSFTLPWVVLTNRETGMVLLRAAGHHPAHQYRLRQWAANDAVLKELGPALEHLVAKFHPDTVTYSADFNMGLTTSRVQSRLNNIAPEIGLHLFVPPKRTAIRTIDGVLTTGVVFDARMLARSPGLDHRGFTFGLRGVHRQH